MQSIYIFGTGGHSSVIEDVVTLSNACEVKGFIVSNNLNDNNAFLEKDVYNQEYLTNLDSPNVVIAIGDNYQRRRIALILKKLNPSIKFPNIIHPRAIVSKSALQSMGHGNVILAGAVVNAKASIGNFCILNTSSVLEHDCKMGDYSSLGPKAAAGGKTQIGDLTAICIGAVLSNSIYVGNNTVIGANSLVLENVPNDVLAFGTPAKVIRKRNKSDKYL